MTFLDTLWLVPLFPACGAVLIGLLGRRFSRRGVSVLCVGTAFAAFAWALGAVLELRHLPGRQFERVWFAWLPSVAGLGHGVGADYGLLLDPLSAVMVLLVTGIGLLIHLYSVGYMAREGGYYRFFGCMNLFLFAMLTLVLADNFLLLFVGWEGVGLCSYLLIGFWFKKHTARAAGLKAFLVNRVGDAGFLLGVLLVLRLFGTVRFAAISATLTQHGVSSGAVMAATLLLFWGASGKSAQLPLFVWLPDAMEGPTPVSALMHAATMVTAGIYLLCRADLLFLAAPQTLGVVAAVGAGTALFAAAVALVQTDIKRVLAFSTISQLGTMFLACGVGAFTAGLFHVVTHAFFKALLFLGAGSVIHALDGEQDLSRMGGLARRLPITAGCMGVATLAIAGIPPLAGFASKDAILTAAWRASPWLWIVAWLTAGLTSLYMFRLYFLTFHGPARWGPRRGAGEPHEAPGSMTGPLLVLAGLCLVGGGLGWPTSLGGANRLAHWLAPVLPVAAEEAGEWGPMAASVLLVLLAASLAWLGYVRRPELPRRWAARWPQFNGWLRSGAGVDAGYTAVFADGLGKRGGAALARFDGAVLDGGVNLGAAATRLTAQLAAWWDTWVVDGVAVEGLARLAAFSSRRVRRLQSGRLQTYALLMVFGLGTFLLFYLLR